MNDPLLLFDLLRHDAQPVGVEHALAAEMRPRRRAEFCSGRMLARRALAQLEVPASAGIGSDATGAPQWPRGVTGSITHVGDIVGVAVARSRQRTVGLDLERIDALSASMITAITAPGELTRAHEASGLALDSPLLWAVLHCAKESAHKALGARAHRPQWNPRTLRILLEPGDERGGAFVVDDATPLRGRWWRQGDHVGALAVAGGEA